MTELAEAANSIVVDSGVAGARPSRSLGRRLAGTPAWVGGVMGVALLVVVWWIL